MQLSAFNVVRTFYSVIRYNVAARLIIMAYKQYEKVTQRFISAMLCESPTSYWVLSRLVQLLGGMLFTEGDDDLK